jgi:hypothetical protein
MRPAWSRCLVRSRPGGNLLYVAGGVPRHQHHQNILVAIREPERDGSNHRKATRAATVAGPRERVPLTGVPASVGGSLVPTIGWIRDRYIEPVKTSLGGGAFETALAEGRAMPVVQAIALARQQALLIWLSVPGGGRARCPAPAVVGPPPNFDRTRVTRSPQENGDLAMGAGELSSAQAVLHIFGSDCQQISAHPSDRNASWMSAAGHTARADGETDSAR